MHLGIVVDGKTEYCTIETLVTRACRGVKCSVAKADIQPKSAIGQQALRAIEGYKVLAPNGIEKLIVLVDKEDNKGCDGVLSQALKIDLVAKLVAMGVSIPVEVVLKVRMYENWLAADCVALASLKSRFRNVPRIRQRVERNRADSVDALDIFGRHIIGNPYHKVEDGRLICRKYNPLRAAKHSRSLRRFLHVAGCLAYKAQSKRPHT